MKLSKQEQKYRAKQQLAHKFTQKEAKYGTLNIFSSFYSSVDKDAVRKLVDRVCK